jgi:hypothetical protein
LGGVDVVERALFLYYPHIKVAVTEWLQGGTEDPPLTDRTFDVYFALRKLHQLMSQYDRYRPATLNVYCVDAHTLRVCGGACAACAMRSHIARVRWCVCGVRGQAGEAAIVGH